MKTHFFPDTVNGFSQFTYKSQKYDESIAIVFNPINSHNSVLSHKKMNELYESFTNDKKTGFVVDFRMLSVEAETEGFL